MRFRLVSLLVVIALLAALFSGWSAMSRSMEDFFRAAFVGETGEIQSSEDWPSPLRSLVDESRIPIDTSTIRVFCLGSALNSEYVWRLQFDKAGLSWLQQNWHVSESTSFRWQYEGKPESLPVWWNLEPEAEMMYFSSLARNSGRKGESFDIAFDPNDELLFVHYNFNF